ncbi:glycerol kinase [Thalassospira profundimaris]|uniref:Glycerol kinase n=1 Tax=Thalassospira profundimaris TaxID=502049 RepID=A0A367WH32_9PROT|nr:glycerol kinase GlpK [Thalassospira profundimaris]RCK40569.1 glycerol kinase [Thalassospira profundimaris]
MSDKKYILAIDQGTTSSRAIVFNRDGKSVAVAQREFPQHFPNSGWVEHDPEDLWDTVVETCREAISHIDVREIAAIGITNQRETTIVWDRKTGKPVYNAIVWQDRRTAALCRELRHRDPDLEQHINAKSGLLIDPYFSATKIAWILDHVTGSRARAEQGDLAFGTVDSFLLWRLTGGKSHATDATNAARTNLYNIRDDKWDAELCDIFRVPEQMLPEVKDCAADFGMTDKNLFGAEIPVYGIAGDQQAAAFGQCCFNPGEIKSTYGTGCFVILNTGDEAVTSQHRLLTTIGYRLNGKISYAMEGAIFVAGAAVQWLRDGLGIIKSAAETEGLAGDLPDNRGVYMVPAFTGLGAPYWDADARGAVFGLTRDTGPREFVRAALESVCYQTFDLFDAMAADGVAPKAVRVDGGMVANDWICQYLADILSIDVERPQITETTALGAACLAGLQAGLFSDLDEIRSRWKLDAKFSPKMAGAQRDHVLDGWRDAVARVRTSDD